MSEQPIYSIAQMKAWEDQQAAAGLSYAEMMRRAGQRAAADLLLRFSEPQNTVVLCGKGNNAGDGLVMAKALAEAGWVVSVLLLQGSDLSPLALINLAKLPQSVKMINADQLAHVLETSQVVIDAVYGTGFHGVLPVNVAVYFDVVNQHHRSFKVALDIPSGIHGDSAAVAAHAFEANLTYAFQALKHAHVGKEAQNACGEIVRIDLC